MNRFLLSTICLAGLASCTSTSVDTTPLVTTDSSDTTAVDGISANTSAITNATSILQIEGRYSYDADECTPEKRSSGTVSFTKLEEIRSGRNAMDFVVTVTNVSTTSNSATTINILTIAQGSSQTRPITSTPSGTFSTMSLLGRNCGIEFVEGGAVATCRYAEVPATCNWFLSRK